MGMPASSFMLTLTGPSRSTMITHRSRPVAHPQALHLRRCQLARKVPLRRRLQIIYNCRRRHSGLGYLAPVQAYAQMARAASTTYLAGRLLRRGRLSLAKLYKVENAHDDEDFGRPARGDGYLCAPGPHARPWRRRGGLRAKRPRRRLHRRRWPRRPWWTRRPRRRRRGRRRRRRWWPRRRWRRDPASPPPTPTAATALQAVSAPPQLAELAVPALQAVPAVPADLAVPAVTAARQPGRTLTCHVA